MLLKHAQYVSCWVRLCVGQNQSSVSSQHRKEVQSLILPAI
jgi:hypothetical protein